MRFVAFSDTHGCHCNICIPSQNNIDVAIFAGDFCRDKTVQDCITFLDWFRQYPAKYKILVAGNHDLPFESDPERFLNICSQNDIIYLQDSSCEIEGVIFYGAPWTPIFRELSAFKMMSDGDDIRAVWSKIPEETDVLITHGPPYSILDRLPIEGSDSFVHAGDKVLMERVNAVNPTIHVFGHAHSDADKTLVRNKTMFINACVPEHIDSDFVPETREVNWVQGL